MSSENNTFDNITSSSSTNSPVVISNTVIFWIYLVFLIPSILCSLFYLCNILFRRTLRNALHNHVICVVLSIGLIYEVTLYPWMLNFYHYNGTWQRSPIFCTIWGFTDWGLYFTQSILFAWATIERHILIFHNRWVSTKRKRLFVHYLPFTTLLIYCLIFYIYVSFFPPCQNTFDDTSMDCVYFCFENIYVLYMWDIIVHQTLPNVVIAVFSVALLIRTLYQKQRFRQPIRWQRYRKITIQLLSISVLYLIFVFPLTFMNILYLCGFSTALGDIVYNCLSFSNYLMQLFLPFACILSLPELRKKVNIFPILHIKTRTIFPTT